jgi:hypothetical protein
MNDLTSLRDAQEYLKYLDSIANPTERVRFMAQILATEASNAAEPLLAELQRSEVALGQAQDRVEALRPAYEVLKPTVNPNACPCEFCRARDELIAGVGKLLEEKTSGQEGKGG